jgi:glycosyltransferase involved in cell wall biosynthesis
LTDKVRLIVDAPSAQVNDLLNRAWLFALHSQEESQGIALCEALARGVPVIASDVAAIPYVVPHEQVGLLSPYGDVASFARDTERLLQDSELRARMSKAAREWAKRFDWQQIVSAVDELFRQRIAT